MPVVAAPAALVASKAWCALVALITTTLLATTFMNVGNGLSLYDENIQWRTFFGTPYFKVPQVPRVVHHKPVLDKHGFPLTNISITISHAENLLSEFEQPILVDLFLSDADDGFRSFGSSNSNITLHYQSPQTLKSSSKETDFVIALDSCPNQTNVHGLLPSADLCPATSQPLIHRYETSRSPSMIVHSFLRIAFQILLRAVILLLETLINYFACFAPEWLQLATGAWMLDKLISSYESNVNEDFVSFYQMQCDELRFLTRILKATRMKNLTEQSTVLEEYSRAMVELERVKDSEKDSLARESAITVDKLETELDSVKKSATATKVKFDEEIDKLQNDLESGNQELTRMKDEMTNKEKEFEILLHEKEKQSELQSEKYQDASSKLETKLREIKETTAALEDKASKHEILEASTSEMKKEIEVATRRAKEAEKKAGDMDGKVKDVEDQLKEMEMQADEAEKKASDMEKKVEDVEKHLEEMEVQANEAEKKVEEATRRAKEAEKKTDDMEKKMEDVEKQLKEMEMKVDEAEKKVEEARQKAQDAELNAVRQVEKSETCKKGMEAANNLAKAKDVQISSIRNELEDRRIRARNCRCGAATAPLGPRAGVPSPKREVPPLTAQHQSFRAAQTQELTRAARMNAQGPTPPPPSPSPSTLSAQAATFEPRPTPPPPPSPPMPMPPTSAPSAQAASYQRMQGMFGLEANYHGPPGPPGYGPPGYGPRGYR